MDQALQILQETFKFPNFRAAQREVIERLINGENALALLPTGGGKSLCFQVPALCFTGLTLVISPLISLMKDQVEALKGRDVCAASLDSTLTASQAIEVKEAVLNGELKILYVAPERLNNEGFMHMMGRVKIALLAVDESHCINLKIARFARELNVERVVCLTATATQEVAADICTSFCIDPVKGVFKTSVYRPKRVTNAKTFDEKMERLVPFLQGRKGPSIVYVTLQKQAEHVASALKREGINAMVYHAGLKTDQRNAVQNAFMSSTDGIVVATIAFGMGIDKADIRQVVHLYMPKTLENFSQEVGRAGRDGLSSDCLMFLCAEDIPALEGFARGDTCSKRSLELWLGEVAMKTPASDGTVDFNHFQQTKLYDIRSNTLGLLYAQLELDFNFIRAVTPFYSLYEIRERTRGTWEDVLSDNSTEAKVVRKCWKASIRYHKIDVVDAAAASGMDRERLAKQISKWELDGLIETKASQARHRYLITGDLPKTNEQIAAAAGKLFERMTAREEEAVENFRKVIAFGSGSDCLARMLALHFGDENAIPGGTCKNCTFCATGQPVSFNAAIKTRADPAQVEAILSACLERDDPRLLARFAFGISSPRLTELKLGRHVLFGSMGSVDYRDLLAIFEKACRGANFCSVESTDIQASKKRPAPARGLQTAKKAKR